MIRLKSKIEDYEQILLGKNSKLIEFNNKIASLSGQDIEKQFLLEELSKKDANTRII